MKNTVATLAAMKRNGEKISQLTCYDYSTAKLIDAAGINMILVGDSLGMTMQGYCVFHFCPSSVSSRNAP